MILEVIDEDSSILPVVGKLRLWRQTFGGTLPVVVFFLRIEL